MKTIIKCFSVYDSKADAWMTPFFAATIPVGIRTFQDGAMRTESIVHKHPEDFALYCVGDFNVDTGEITSFPAQSLGTAIQILSPDEPTLEAVQ